MPMKLPSAPNKALDNSRLQANSFEVFMQDPALKLLLGVLNLIPGASAIAIGCETILATYNQMGLKRQIAFFEELRKEPYRLTEGVINNEPFLHKFLITYRAVIMTNRKEKIEYFARLLKSSTYKDLHVDIDEYEEYLNILNDLSYRELIILAIIDKYFILLPEPPSSIPSEGTVVKTVSNPAWNNWQKEIFPKIRAEILQVTPIRDAQLDDILIRLSRSGLYKQINYMDGDNGNGCLTPLFFRLKELIHF